MLVKRKVAVKVIVTENFKLELLARLKQALERVESAQQQLEAQGQGYLAELEAKDPSQAEDFRQKLDAQKRKQSEIKTRLAQELADAKRLEVGGEYHQGAVEGIAEIQLGDNLDTQLNTAEIIIKDGIVAEIRNA